MTTTTLSKEERIRLRAEVTGSPVPFEGHRIAELRRALDTIDAIEADYFAVCRRSLQLTGERDDLLEDNMALLDVVGAALKVLGSHHDIAGAIAQLGSAVDALPEHLKNAAQA